jgi:hypothetical protein
MTRLDLQACHYERLSNIRRWQIRTGSNHFCFNGKCVTGRNLFGAIIFICLISLITLLWLVFELPFLMKEFNNNNLIILIVGLLLIFYTYSKKNNTEILNSVVYFFRSMCTDPGIIQRPSSIERLILKNELNLNQLICDIEVNDMIVKYKYCVASQVQRYGPYTAVYDYFADCITAVISGTEIRPYHNEVTAVYGVVLLCQRLRKNTIHLRRRMKQIYGENMDSRID